jgi:nucleoside-diphosphate-sugar epimerase
LSRSNHESLSYRRRGVFRRAFVKKLLERGYSVRIFDINRPAYTDRAMQLIQADIRDLRAILSACEGIDVAFHNVAQVPLARPALN